MNYTYEKKMIYGRKCIVELETDFFVILVDVNLQKQALNFDQNGGLIIEKSGEAMQKIKK